MKDCVENLNFLPQAKVDTYYAEHTIILDIEEIGIDNIPCSDNYIFIIPHFNNFSLIVNHQTHSVSKNNVFPVNPQQSVKFTASAFKGLIIFIEKSYLQNIAYSIFNRNDVVFFNEQLPTTPHLQHLLNLFMEEVSRENSGYQFVIKSLNIQLSINLLRRSRHNLNSSADQEYIVRKSVETAVNFLMKNYQHNISLEDIARVVDYSPYHFLRMFKEETGKTPFEYLLDIKLENAKKLLKLTDKSITEVCFACGFNNRSHFSHIFKKKVGISPSAYRNLKS